MPNTKYISDLLSKILKKKKHTMIQKEDLDILIQQRNPKGSLPPCDGRI